VNNRTIFNNKAKVKRHIFKCHSFTSALAVISNKMTLQEQKVLNAINNLYQSLSEEGKSWDGIVYQRMKIFETSVEKKGILEKFSSVKQVLAMYGGMGSIEDQDFNSTTNELKDKVYSECFALLKSYWKELGNESYGDNDFAIFPIGTKVKLLPGSVRYFDNNEIPVYASKNMEDLATIWKVISNRNRDITNMIEYGIYAKGTYSTARHSCLEIAK
jgi:hypothetical protein